MKSIALLFLSLAGQFVATTFNPGATIGTPTYTQFAGKNVIDKNAGGSTTAVNGVNFTLDPTAWPQGVTTGSLVIISGTWPDHPTTGNGYAQSCTSPCAPTFTDNGTGNSWNAVFTAGSGCKDTGLQVANGGDHGIYYAMNFTPAATTTPTQITETHTNKISDSYWNVSNWYNVATTSALRTSSCKTGVVPANNTAPNISGTAMTVVVGDLVYIEVDDESANNGINPNGNIFNSVTTPSGCNLLDENGYAGHVELSCIATSTSFTPQFTISQTVHDSFTIMAAAFKPGAGGSAPSVTGAAVLLSRQTMTANAGSYTENVPCPTTTTTFAVTDDAGSISAVADSNSDTFTKVQGSASATIYYKLGISISTPNTFKVTLTSGGGNTDLITFFCMSATSVDTGFAVGGGGTQVTTSTILNSVTTSGGGADSTYTNLPTGTPGQTKDLFIMVGAAGDGPYLSCTQPTGCVYAFPSPTITTTCSVTTAGVCGGDSNQYTNGDMTGWYWVNSTSAINWGWSMQNNTSSNNSQVTAFH